jgi:hypothetical protein
VTDWAPYRGLAAFALLLVLGSGSLACGSTDDSTSSTSGSSASSSATTGDIPTGVASERAAFERTHFGRPSPSSAPFSKYSGKGQARLHLAEFGSEADGAVRNQVEAVVDSYLLAVKESDWAKGCGYLMAEVRAQIERPPDKLEQAAGRGCAEALHLTVKLSSRGKTPAYAPAGIASLRIEGGAGFALFHGSDGDDHWVAVKRDAGEWKVLSTTPQPFG